jgi:hypothetical protein
MPSRSPSRRHFNGPKAPLGYVVGPDRKLAPDEATKQIVVDAFDLRAGGATAKAVRAMLAERGVKRSSPACGRCSPRASTSASFTRAATRRT